MTKTKTTPSSPPSRAFFLLFLLLAIRDASSQTDSCASNLAAVDVISFDTTSLTCITAWSSHDYILRYKQESTDVWSFVLSTPADSSYVAIGFSSDGRMVGSSAVVGWISSNVGMMKHYALDGTTPNQVKPDEGNLNILSNSSSMVLQSSRMYMAFQLNTSMPQSNVIYSIGPSGFTPGSTYQLVHHTDQVSTSINYNSGLSVSQKAPHTGLRKSHGILNMLSWGILMIIGIMVARHAKNWDPVWFYAHTSIQSTAFVLGVIGIISGFVLEDKLNVSVSSHKSLGIVILVLGCLQVMAILARQEKGTKWRRYWNWYHHTVGRIMVVFAAANVFYGIHLGNEGSSWNAGYGIVLAVLIVAAIALEIRLLRQK